ncbi:UNVERIFIED_CONTAM: hypothetical protein FKN15_071675 [Acipenser sinensis]
MAAGNTVAAEGESLLVPLLQPEGEEPLQTLPSRGEEQELPLPPTPPLGEVELLLPPSWPGPGAPPSPSPGDASLPSPGPACCSASPAVACVSLVSPRVAAGPPSPPEGPLLPPSPPEGPLPLLPVVTTGFALLGVAASPSWQQGILWTEPHKEELPATKKGGKVRRPPSPQPRPPPLCHSPVPGGWFPQPGLPDTQAPCLDLWSLGLTPRSQHHQAQEVAWSPAPLPLVAQTSLHSCLGSHLCLGLQPTARLPALLTPHPLRLGPLSPGLGPARKALDYGQTLPQGWERKDNRGLEGGWMAFKGGGGGRGAMCAAHKGGKCSRAGALPVNNIVCGDLVVVGRDGVNFLSLPKYM